jgi:TetR/AcrR family tetracycline transcriptional repressor
MTRRRGRQDVVDAALQVLDDSGLDALTLREVARRLDAHLNTVSFQVKTKARLLELLADTVMGSLTLEDLPVEPINRVYEILRRYRSVLLSYRDGARLVAGTNVVEQNTLRVGNAIVQALLDAHVTPDAAASTFWGLHYFLLGLVQEEQSEDGAARDGLMEQLADGRFPALGRVQRELLTTSFDERFDFGIHAILRSAQSRPQST